jgi:hypothetical protein
MLIRYCFHLSLWLSATVFGPLGYFLARYTGIGYSIWGNDVDGWGGDEPYRGKEALSVFRKPWPDFWWSVVRNPANNLARRLSAKGEVIAIQRSRTMVTVTMQDSRRYFFFFTPHWPVMFKIGYKIWPTVIAGDAINAKLAFSIQRGHKTAGVK